MGLLSHGQGVGRLGQMGHTPLGVSQKSQQRCATFDPTGILWITL